MASTLTTPAGGMVLRDYQIEARDAVLAEWAGGNLSTLMAASTGLGKTEVFLAILAAELEAGRLTRALILAHTRELVHQPRNRILRNWPQLGPVGVVMADEDETDARIVCATWQTLCQRERFDRVVASGSFSHLIHDECFPAGTLVDGRQIETIAAGETVTAYDEDAGCIRRSVVSGVFRQFAGRHLVRIHAGNRSIVCTLNHQILTKHGWKPAVILSQADCLRITGGDEYGDGHSSDVRELRMRRKAYRQHPHRSLPEIWKDLLLRCLQADRDSSGIIRADGTNQSALCIGKDEDPQSDAPAGIQGAYAGNPHRYELGTAPSGRERKRVAAGAASVSECTRMAHGSHSFDRNASAERRAFTVALQGGCSESRLEDRYRGGRGVSLSVGAEGTRRQESGILDWARVDGVEVLESGSDGTFGGLCPDGYVYNLEVDPCHTYFANGIVVHNCHHASSAGQTRIRDWCRELNPALRVLGATATPERADGTALRSAFGSVAYVRDIIDSIEAGNLAKPITMAVKIDADLSGVALVNGDYDSAALGQALAVENVEQIIYSTWQRWCSDRKTIAFCASVAQAKALAEYFSARGVAAGEVDGETPKRERDAILARFQATEPGSQQLQVVASCAVLTEGVDLPITSALLMARPTRSTSLYVQMFGRGLRLYPGKADCIVIDVAPLGGRDLALAGDLLAGEERKHRARTATRPDESVSPDFARAMQAVDPDRVHLAIVELERAKLLYWEFREGLGIATVNAEATLVIAVPSAERVQRLIGAKAPADAVRYFSAYRLWLSAKRQPPEYLDADEDWGKLSKRADAWARRRIDKRLAGKARVWRLGPPTEKARDAAVRCGVWRDGMTANDVSVALSFAFAGGNIRTAERRMFAEAMSGRFVWPAQARPAATQAEPVQRVMLFGQELEV